MDTTLLMMNTPSASSMTVLRLKRENSTGVTGPHTAITSAKTVTVQPACGTVTRKASAIRGSMPTTPISVFRMPNTPKVSIRTVSPPPFLFIQDSFRSDVLPTFEVF